VAQAPVGQAGTTAASPPSAPPTSGPALVTLALAGDVHFEGPLRRLLATDPAAVLAHVAPVLSGADLAVVNLETAVTERGQPEPKSFTFRAPPAALRALAAAGVDAASMANNHALDFGPESVVDALAAARAARFPLVGIGGNAAEAYAPWRASVRGVRVAVLAASQVLPSPAWAATDRRAGVASAYDLGRLSAAVRAVRAEADVVVVYLHWGTERASCPNAAQQRLARALASAGADVVAGTHAHRLQAAGSLGPTFVAYGLGNFAFATPPGAGAETGVLRLTLVGRRVGAYEWVPARITGGVPVPLAGPDADAARARWSALRACAGLAA
jgi:poly-gamma-glutamate synthesis protein (capsule biosynthesis protein)